MKFGQVGYLLADAVNSIPQKGLSFYLGLMKIGITSVFVDDPVRAFGFYTEVLGFTEKLFKPKQWIAIVVSSEEPDGTSLMLEPNHNAIAKRYQQGLYKEGIPAIVFTTTDIEAEHKRLLGLGVHFRKVPVKTKDGIEALFEDGFGNIIQMLRA